MASSLLLCLLLCSYYAIAHGGNEHDFVVVPTSSFASEPACSAASSRATSAPNRASVPLAHRHGACAPSGATDKPSLAERLHRDRGRRNYIVSKASGRTTLLSEGGVSIPTSRGDAVDSLEYVVTLGIGTPAVEQTVLMDTGSDLSWVQCKPCNSSECYPQKDPLFDPSSSSTYTPIPCDTDACRDLGSDTYNHGCTNGTGPSLCQYGIRYGGGSTTVGLYSTETLTLKPGVSIKNFSFGCGFDQHGPYDKFDGLLGLGGAPESLVSQTTTLYGGAFSYCLPPGNSTAGFLALGAPSNHTAGFVFTPLHRFPDVATFYMVTLAGISVGGKQLDIPPTVFSKGMIIDSGTVVTGLPATAYSALRSAFRSAMSAYPLLPRNDGLDTCYNLTGLSNVTVPKVALTFSGGATIDLDVPSGVLLEGCLAFVGGSSDSQVGIIGNVNQRTFEVLYDSGKGKVGFRPGAC
ncbi:aspartyl protease family protein At5g10770-like [Phragmites australis]|uniref:aspartyl protease family protein At5g10770-like n=1 Tax=Phragmites australis TaxID=29695 RepID=UPI002D7A06BE|nr:aspartyl protease family protein At5g10770-like [Phragmites australis]